MADDFDVDTLTEFERRGDQQRDFNEKDPRVGGSTWVFRAEPSADDDVGDFFNLAVPGLS
jgi:hypothetical protein